MPYTVSSPNLPSNVKAASSGERAQWVAVWNSAYTAAKKKGKSDKEAENAAFAQANGVLKKREAHMGLLNFAGKTKTEGGAAFPAAAFAYVPDPSQPSTWKLRLWESPEKKETAHQVGAAVAAFTSFRGNKVDIPAKDLAGAKAKVRAAWKRVNPGKSADDMPDSIKMSACFSIRDEEAGIVQKWGKLFEAGDYKGHKFTMTPEEVDAVPAGFTPCHLNLQHAPSILDGKLGSLEEVEAEDGILFGRVAVPIWLDEAIGDRPFTVSTEWDRATKQLDGLAIEIDPAVEDAVLFAAKREMGEDPEAEEKAALDHILTLPMPGLDQPIVEKCLAMFAARHDTYAGQGVIQDVHDTVARYGAVCTDPGDKANMQSQHEADAMQATHDMMTEHGAKCSSKSTGSGTMPWMFKADPIVRESEDGAGTTQKPEKEQSRMSKLMDDIKAMLARAGVDPDADIEDPKTTPKPEPKTEPKTEPTVDMAANTEIVRLRAENARMQQDRITEQAEKFVDEIIRDGRATLAEKPAMMAVYVQDAQDDLTNGKVMLASGQEGTRIDKLAALFAAKPKFNLTDERLPELVHAAIVTLAKTDDKAKEDLSPEKIKELAEATPAGKTLMAKNGATSH